VVDGCEIGAVSGDGGPGEDEGLGDGVGVFDDYVEVLWCFGAGELSQIYISGGCGDEGAYCVSIGRFCRPCLTRYMWLLIKTVNRIALKDCQRKQVVGILIYLAYIPALQVKISIGEGKVKPHTQILVHLTLQLNMS